MDQSHSAAGSAHTTDVGPAGAPVGCDGASPGLHHRFAQHHQGLKAYWHHNSQRPDHGVYKAHRDQWNSTWKHSPEVFQPPSSSVWSQTVAVLASVTNPSKSLYAACHVSIHNVFDQHKLSYYTRTGVVCSLVASVLQSKQGDDSCLALLPGDVCSLCSLIAKKFPRTHAVLEALISRALVLVACCNVVERLQPCRSSVFGLVTSSMPDQYLLHVCAQP